MTIAAPSCPNCSSPKIAEILFGFPNDIESIQSKLDSGELILGGCDVSTDSPKWHCLECRHEWGVSEWKTIIEDSVAERDREFAEAESAADARGIFTATANEGGYVKCPHCGRTFSIRYPMSWDGRMHKSCHTRLQITNGEQGGGGNSAALHASP
jgi:hypothetical protein